MAARGVKTRRQRIIADRGNFFLFETNNPNSPRARASAFIDSTMTEYFSRNLLRVRMLLCHPEYIPSQTYRV
jgi:hypothetical protein